MKFGSPLRWLRSPLQERSVHPQGERGLKRCPKNILFHHALASIPRLAEIPYYGRKKERKRPKPKTKVLNLGAWNVRTLMDNAKAKIPERITALVATELARYNIDIAALGTQWDSFYRQKPTERKLQRLHFLLEWTEWRGTPRSRCGFCHKFHLAHKLTKIPEGLNDRLMTLKIPLTNKKSA